MKKSLAQRQREKAAVKRGITPSPAPKVVIEEEIDDASELEYQEKTTRKKRSYTRRKKDDN